MRKIAVLVGLISLLFLINPVYAFIYSGHRWMDPAMGEPYLINPNCTDPEVGNVIDAIGAGARAWMNEGNANFTFTYGGWTGATLPNDGQQGGPANGANEIMFVQASQNYWYFLQNPGAIAVTWTWIYTGTNFIAEDDMAFNDGGWVFSAVGDPTSTEFDVWDIAAHEFGHYLALSDILIPTTATMYAYAWLGETYKRDLDPDDVAGIQYIYSATANTNPVLWNGFVTPATGGLATVFSYRVNYYDANNGFGNCQATVNGTAQNMTLFSGTPASGIYKYDTTLTFSPTEQYGFYCEDGQGGNDILPVLGYFSGPQVIPVTVDLNCLNPVVPQGGTLQFTITVANQTTQAGYNGLTATGYVILPNGSQFGPVLGPANFNISPSQTILRNRSQFIPVNAPLGNYTYFLNLTSGTYLIFTDSFPFTVTAPDKRSVGGSTEWSGSWQE